MPRLGLGVGLGRRRSTGGSSPPPGPWLLTGGVWADSGSWADSANWID